MAFACDRWIKVEDNMRAIADAIEWCRPRRLGLVLDAHFLPGADFNSQGGDKRVFTDMALQEKVAGVWRELAKAFAQHGDYLRMEILNEPVAEENLNRHLATAVIAVLAGPLWVVRVLVLRRLSINRRPRAIGDQRSVRAVERWSLHSPPPPP